MPPPASDAAAAAAAAEHAELMRCGDADRPLRLAFRMLMAYLEVSYPELNDLRRPRPGPRLSSGQPSHVRLKSQLCCCGVKDIDVNCVLAAHW